MPPIFGLHCSWCFMMVLLHYAMKLSCLHYSTIKLVRFAIAFDESRCKLLSHLCRLILIFASSLFFMLPDSASLPVVLDSDEKSRCSTMFFYFATCFQFLNFCIDCPVVNLLLSRFIWSNDFFQVQFLTYQLALYRQLFALQKW